jgi:ABC-type transport system substrate-binding protein
MMVFTRHRLSRTITLCVAALFLVFGVILTPSQSQQRPMNRVVIALNGEPDSLDGHESSNSLNLSTFPLLYDKLAEFDADMNLVPQLATEWSVSRDGMTWTFKLRRGVKFHDGSPVNGDAVKRSIERTVADSRLRNWFTSIKSVASPDDSTVTVTTEKPFLFLPQRLATPPGSIVHPSAKGRTAAFGASPIGSGPFKFKEWVRGNKIVLEKNPDHWNARATNIDQIEFRFLPDDSGRAIALETGEIDFALPLTPQEAERLKRNNDITIYNARSLRWFGLYMNLMKKPFDDVRVRHAIAHAIDKDAIVRTTMAGYAKVADSPLPPGVWGYKSFPQYAYNPQRARQLLTEAGLPNGFSATMWVPTGNYLNAVQVSEAAAAMLERVGIKLKLETMEAGRWIVQLRSRGPREATWEMSYYGFGTWTGEPDYALGLLFHTEQFAPGGSNRQFYSNSRVDSLLDIGHRTVDDRQRRLIYESIQDQIWKDQPWAYLFYGNQVMGSRRAVRNVQILPSETVLFREARVSR